MWRCGALLWRCGALLWRSVVAPWRAAVAATFKWLWPRSLQKLLKALAVILVLRRLRRLLRLRGALRADCGGTHGSRSRCRGCLERRRRLDPDGLEH